MAILRALSAAPIADPCTLALAPHSGTNSADAEIIRWQKEVHSAADTNRALERLGWAFVAKARQSFDDTFYTRAEQCALCLDSRAPGSVDALLLRGHVLHNQHRFKAAEPLARELVRRRGAPFDHGLLGDLLMEQGKLSEAAREYQKMVDLRPDLQSYARAAHLRWLTGDLEGAIDLMQRAAKAASPLDGDSAAWVHTRLALLRLQSGDLEKAHQSCESALTFRSDYAPALLARGRVLLATGKTSGAVESLQRAAALDPLPEYEWALAEALRAANRPKEAGTVETQLERAGEFADPRTFALYLATRGRLPAKAVELAEKELATRQDVFTHDALAWALAAAERWSDASARMEKALAENTSDARLYCHAAVIAARSGRKAEAKRWFDKATKGIHALLPSEQELLLDAAAISAPDK